MERELTEDSSEPVVSVIWEINCGAWKRYKVIRKVSWFLNRLVKLTSLSEIIVIRNIL